MAEKRVEFNWDSEGGGDRGRQQTEDIRKIKLNNIITVLYFLYQILTIDH